MAERLPHEVLKLSRRAVLKVTKGLFDEVTAIMQERQQQRQWQQSKATRGSGVLPRKPKARVGFNGFFETEKNKPLGALRCRRLGCVRALWAKQAFGFSLHTKPKGRESSNRGSAIKILCTKLVRR